MIFIDLSDLLWLVTAVITGAMVSVRAGIAKEMVFNLIYYSI